MELDRGQERPSFGQWLTQRRVVPSWVPLALAVSWIATLQLLYILEPAAARNGPSPAWAIPLEILSIAALTATAMGLVGRQRLGLVASAGAVGVFLVGAVMCPVSGHHAAVGAWWYGQLAALTALGGVSLAGLRLARRGGES